MNHLTEEQLNEFLDHQATNAEEIKLHLSSCDECAARFHSLQTLFHELDSLPEVALTRNLAAAVMHRVSLPAKLPAWLKLTVLVQLILAVVAIILAAPFVATYVPSIQAPSLTQIFIDLQMQWTIWLDTLSTFQIPSMPVLPMADISSIVIFSTLAGVSMLWLVGNGLLLRNQIK